MRHLWPAEQLRRLSAKALLGSALLGTTLLAAVLTGILPVPAWASFRLVPIEMDFEPAGRGATQIFEIASDSAEPVALEIRTYRRAMGPRGEETLTEAPDDWIIYPEQIILQPRESQSIRLQWAGTATPTSEIAYRLIAEQLAIDLGKAKVEGGQVRLLVTYKASLYVVPPGAKGKISVVSASPATIAGGGPALAVTLRNDGNRHQMLRAPTLTLTAGGRSVTLTEKQLEGLAGENILAGVTRTLLVRWPDGLPIGPVTAGLSLP
jgi:fimbrial chaperone protein